MLEEGYTVAQIGCVACGSACDPLSPKCPSCGAEPFADVVFRVGPLSKGRFWLSVGVASLLLGGIVRFVFHSDGWGLGQALSRFSPFVELLIKILFVGLAVAIVLQLVSLWRATRMCLLVRGSAGLTRVMRTGDSRRILHVGWHEVGLPLPSKRAVSFGCLMNLLALLTGGILHALAHVLFDTPRELRIPRRRLGAQPLRVVFVLMSARVNGSEVVLHIGSQLIETELLTIIARYTFKQWLSEGLVHIEQGYEPSPERPFLALDLTKRRLRAYPFHQVLLEEASPSEGELLTSASPSSSNSSPNPQESEPSPNAPRWLPVASIPYENGYWLRADWNLIDAIESRLKASEVAQTPPVPAPQPE